MQPKEEKLLEKLTLQSNLIGKLSDMSVLCCAQEVTRGLLEPMEQIASLSSTFDLLNKYAIPNSLFLARPACSFASTVLAGSLKRIDLPSLYLNTEVYDKFAQTVIQAPNQMAPLLVSDKFHNLQKVLTASSLNWQDVFTRSPFMQWLNSVVFSNLPEELGDIPVQALYKYLLATLHEARWFPDVFALTNQEVFDEVTKVIVSSRIKGSLSKNCTKRIDNVIFSFYSNKEINRIKNDWNQSDLGSFLKRSLGYAISAYIRKEYVLVIPFLTTLWEYLIVKKTGAVTTGPKYKNNVKNLFDRNGCNNIFTDFYNNSILMNCRGLDQVVEDLPGRHQVAHGWYLAKPPTRKAALNAILLTDFIIKLKPVRHE